MILYKNFVLYVFAFILTFYVTTKSLIPNAGFALVAMVWLMVNTIFLYIIDIHYMILSL